MRTKIAPTKLKRGSISRSSVANYKVLAVKISEDIERESAEHYHRTASESQTVQECYDCSREILSCARTEAE